MKFSTVKNRRLLIAGAKFGEIYLNTFMQAQPGLELAGLLANGSERAQQLAHDFGIPLYTEVEQVPDDIDIVCIVVRSTVAGGSGTALAEAFLKRGIHVIQEHPMHPNDIVHLQQLAVQHQCRYWINSFYPYSSAGRCWIDRAQRVRCLLSGEAAHFAHLTTSRQLLYSSLDLLLQATQTTDAAVTTITTDDPIFQTLQLQLSGCNATLRLQAYFDPQDPDLHSLVMHQLTLGWPSGYLSLEASYGPVLWTSSLYDPHHLSTQYSLYRAATYPESAYLRHPAVLNIHSAPLNWQQAFEVDGPASVSYVLQAFCRHLDGDAAPAGFDTDYQLALARLWQNVLRCAGAANECSTPPPPVIQAQDLLTPLFDVDLKKTEIFAQSEERVVIKINEIFHTTTAPQENQSDVPQSEKSDLVKKNIQLENNHLKDKDHHAT